MALPPPLASGRSGKVSVGSGQTKKRERGRRKAWHLPGITWMGRSLPSFQLAVRKGRMPA